MSYPSSLELKDSGVEWLGNIPAHWEIERARWLFRERDERSETGEEELLTVSHLTGVTPRSEKDVNMFEAATTEGYKICYAGDLIINTLWAWMGAMGVSPVNGIVSPAYNVYVPCQRFEPNYIDALVRVPVFAEEATRYSKGVWSSRLRLYPEGFFEIWFPVPPIDEQRTIADYLDRETARLDALVAAKERLLQLLAEKRRALITRAVTRGLNPDAPMRDSGIPWLGEIPAHWETSKFSWSVFIIEGQVDPEVEPYSNMLLIAPNHIESGTGKLIGSESAAEQAAMSGKYLCQTGDVIYSKIRPALRKATLALQECLCSADMYPLRIRKGLDAEYLLYFLLSEPFTAWAILESDRVAMPKINREALNDFRLPVPPLFEQRAIIAHIAAETAKLDALRAATERTIALLKERRAALIAAAVTGKLELSRGAR